MFLRSLHIENFRNIESLDIDFGTEDKPRKWTYLLGENGTGKTNILRAIALTLSPLEAFNELYLTSDNWIGNGKQCLIAEATGERGRYNQSATRRIQIEQGQNISGVLQNITAIPTAWHELFRVGYGASRRLSNNPSIQSSSRFRHTHSAQVSTLFIAEEMLNPLESWAMDLDYRDPVNGLKRLRKQLENLLPDIKFSHIDKDKKQLIFQTPDGDTPLNLLSEGYQNMASWIGDLFFWLNAKYSSSVPLKEAQGIILLDEMELHLHPKWQRALRAYLDEKLPNFQIIATTHSPITAQQAREDELYYMERESPTSPPKLHKYRGDPSQLMTHQMLNNPAFGEPTLDSYVVEQKRNQYAHLRTKAARSPSENATLDALSRELEGLPTISMNGRDDDDSVMSLLRKIEKAL